MSDYFTQAPLGELCDVLDKKRKPITKKDRKPGPYPYYGATGVLDHVDGYLFDEPLVLVGEDGAKWGPGDKTAYAISGKTWVNNHAHVLRPKRERILDSWLIYYLNASDITKFITGLTVPKLNQGKLREILVPTPSISVQKRIVAILDESFAGIETAIANTEKNLANARELFDSYLNLVFKKKKKEQITKKLSDVGLIQTGNTPKTSEKDNYGDHIPFIKPGDFRADGSLEYLNNGLSKKGTTKARIVPPDSVLMVCIGATIGKTAFVTNEVATNQQINAITPKTEFKPKFIYYQMLTKEFQESVISRAGQTTLPIISKKKWSELELIFPETIEEQNEIVTTLDDLGLESRRIQIIYQRKLNALQELKQSLLQKAFSGELTAEAEKEDEEAVA